MRVSDKSSIFGRFDELASASMQKNGK